jgi:organic radical activating enzyme
MDSNKPVELITNYKDILRLSIVPHNVCNFSCDYCFPGSNEGNYPFIKNWSIISDNVKHLFNYYIKHTHKKRFDINISGGEPTLWPDLGNFCTALKQNFDVSIMIISNGSRTLRYWEENGDKFDQVVLSCHHKETDLSHTIAVADLLYKKTIGVSGLVMMDPNNWDKCINIVNRLKTSKYSWPIYVQKIEGTYEYSDSQILYLQKSTQRWPNPFYYYKIYKKAFSYQKQPYAIFKDGRKKKLSINDVTANNWNNFYNWRCNLGVDSIQIMPDGRLSGSCDQLLFGMDHYFNIFDEDFKDKFNPTIQPTICKKIYCGCITDINMTKKIFPIQVS